MRPAGFVNRLLHRLAESLLARNASWMLLGQGVRTVIQAAYFILIARSLGAEGYGAFAAVAAMVAIAGPFAGIGSGNLLVKNVSRNKDLFAESWGKALVLTSVSGMTLLGAVVLTAIYVLPGSISPFLALYVGLSDLLFVRILDIGGQAFQAVQRLARTAQLYALLSVARLTAALGLYLCSASPSATQWGFLYLASTAAASLVAVLLVNRELGRPAFGRRGLFSEFQEGLYFSISVSAQNVYNDLDKTMLARFSTLSDTGIYAAGYRLIDVAFMPVRSLLFATYTKFFRQGAAGIAGTLAVARQLAPFAAAYAACAGLMLYWVAPAIPYVLGIEYGSTVTVVRLLAVLPFLRALHYFAADTLTGAGYQGTRSGIQVGVAAFNAVLDLWLIPGYGWRGAAWASVASDGLLAAWMWATVLGLAAGRPLAMRGGTTVAAG